MRTRDVVLIVGHILSLVILFIISFWYFACIFKKKLLLKKSLTEGRQPARIHPYYNIYLI